MPKIMGILNITPDSFSDGGLYTDPEAAVQRALELSTRIDILDVGAESTRPGAMPISAEEELSRLLPVIRQLVNKVPCPISVDTYKPIVAKRCLELGVSIINDVGGLSSEMAEVVTLYDCPIVIMHQGSTEITSFFKQRIEFARQRGIRKIILDPGLGFGKSPLQNWDIVNNIEAYRVESLPILLGPSRKSFSDGHKKFKTKDILQVVLPRLNPFDIIRLHDVSLAT